MKRILLFTIIISFGLAGCVSNPSDPNRKAKQGAATGAALGAIAGAIIGHQRDHRGGALRGALVGAVAGGAIGAGIGNYMDRQQAEFDQALNEEKRNHQVEVERLKNENLKITMNAEVSFDFNSSSLKPAFHTTLDKVADILQRYPQTTIKIIGHTDSRGSAAYNQQLSLQRAQAVANYLVLRGVEARRVITQGMGETEPRVSNDTEAGRQLNRRVEMLIIPNRNIQ